MALAQNSDKTAPFNPYGTAGAHPGQDTRATEAWAMINLAQRLEKVRTDPQASRAAIREAVRLNWRVWSLLQEGFLSAETELPAEVRTNLLSLSRFVDKHSAELLRTPFTDKLLILISINRNLAEGLLGTTAKSESRDQPTTLNQEL